MEAFVFEKFVTDSGLSDETIDSLRQEELTCEESLINFAQNFENDVPTLKLSLCQKGKLRKAVSSLLLQRSPSPVTTKDLKRDKSLNELLHSIESSNLNGVHDLLLSDNAGPSEKISVDSNNGNLTEKGTVRSKKPLFIKDFVSNNKIIPCDDERELFTSGTDSVYMRSQSSKSKPEQVSIPQWISANMRIMSTLIERGDLCSTRDIADYMKYTEEIGEYFQIYTTPSVMLYDHRYRERQAINMSRWGAPDIHSVNFYLRTNFKQPPGPTNFNRKSQSQPVLKDNKGQNLCRDFQQKSGCNRKFCKYSHVCAAEGCRRNHPEYLHSVIESNVQ